MADRSTHHEDLEALAAGDAFEEAAARAVSAQDWLAVACGALRAGRPDQARDALAAAAAQGAVRDGLPPLGAVARAHVQLSAEVAEAAGEGTAARGPWAPRGAAWWAAWASPAASGDAASGERAAGSAPVAGGRGAERRAAASAVARAEAAWRDGDHDGARAALWRWIARGGAAAAVALDALHALDGGASATSPLSLGSLGLGLLPDPGEDEGVLELGVAGILPTDEVTAELETEDTGPW
jgi:hypothetical protein